MSRISTMLDSPALGSASEVKQQRQPIAIIEPADGLVIAPENDYAQGKYEYDVLYENQRGILWFGVPKFSPSTLLQWDPAPWTDIDDRDSPYNIVTAQLPDDTWEWVYPEWVIDMTGDTDEAGWQYAGSFGHRLLPLLAAPFHALFSGRSRAKAEAERRQRRAERLQRRTERVKRKEETRADEGIEALKRSAKARRAKWRARPDANCFVRRRRWIRLRRRRTDEVVHHLRHDAEDSHLAGPS